MLEGPHALSRCSNISSSTKLFRQSRVRYFDPLGRWDEEPCVIDYGDITKIQFDTPYINTLTKYLKGGLTENGRR